jgi:glycosyltransferase involved in cell wall biosynthesis
MAGYRVKQMQYRANAQKSDLIIGGSQWSMSGWRQFGVPSAKLAALPFPLGPEAMRPPAIVHARSGPLLFLHLGRIVPRKRLDLTVRGFAEFRRSFPDARLLVIGRQDYGRDLEIMQTDLTLSAGVEYRDAVPREEVTGLLAAADCVVQTSENENFGAAVAEALAAGRPVLVGPTNGTKDYVPASSFVFTEYTPTAVATGMMEMARRIQADRVGLSADARAAAERHFDLVRVTDRFLELVQHDGV